MALLTADDVLNKKFQPTKFREGYDQDEVDDFLDEVVNTLRAAYAENDELKARIATLQNGQPQSDASGYTASPPTFPEREAPPQEYPEPTQPGQPPPEEEITVK